MFQPVKYSPHVRHPIFANAGAAAKKVSKMIVNDLTITREPSLVRFCEYTTNRTMLSLYAHHANEYIRRAVARNPHTPRDVVAGRLAGDTDLAVVWLSRERLDAA